MKNCSPLFSTAYFTIRENMILFLLLSIMLMVSCNKDDDIEPGIEISNDSIYFSCTINNKFLEFKSPSASLFSSGKGNTRLCVTKNNPKDSSIIEYSREFYDQKYFIAFRFSNVYLVDTLSIFNTPNVKDDLYKKGDHQFQFLSLLDYDKGLPSSPYTGVSIEIFDVTNNKIYTSNISSKYRDNSNEYRNFMDNSLFQITNSFLLDSPPNANDYSSIEGSNNWFIEANFKCKFYELYNQFDPNYIEDTFYISDGILKGCF